MKVLVFPMDMDKVTGFIANARSLKIPIIGSSSVMDGPGNVDVDEFHKLPFVTEPSFNSLFFELLSALKVTHVYTPHGAVWTHLYRMKRDGHGQIPFELCEPSPYEEDWLTMQPSYDWASKVSEELFVESVAADLASTSTRDPRPPLSTGQYASLHRQFLSISGQCDDLKLLALAHIMRLVPKGDIVEIGSFAGRSAFAIAWLAGVYQVGNLTSVDPWDNGKIVDQGAAAKILNKELEEGKALVDLEKIFWSYIGAVSLLDNVGYIRDVSENAVYEYIRSSERGELISDQLGRMPITGRISMLHIDGNHRYDYVCKDISAWEPLVIDGGWVLLDDYIWPFGNGPKQAGDELLLTGKFDIGFVMSDTLFLRKKPVTV